MVWTIFVTLLGLYRGSIGQNEFGDFFVFLGCLIICYRIFGVQFVPKRLIKVPDIFQYSFGHFWNFDNFVNIWTRGPPIYYQNTSTDTRKIWERSWNILNFHIWESDNLILFVFLESHRHFLKLITWLLS